MLDIIEHRSRNPTSNRDVAESIKTDREGADIIRTGLIISEARDMLHIWEHVVFRGEGKSKGVDPEQVGNALLRVVHHAAEQFQAGGDVFGHVADAV